MVFSSSQTHTSSSSSETPSSQGLAESRQHGNTSSSSSETPSSQDQAVSGHYENTSEKSDANGCNINTHRATPPRHGKSRSTAGSTAGKAEAGNREEKEWLLNKTTAEVVEEEGDEM